jgi:hypothetical protein
VNVSPVPVEAVDAVFEPRDLLRAMLGVTSASMRDQVRQVVNHAAFTPVMHDAPISPADEVLTVSFERVFTRAEVTQILGELRSEQA